MYFVHNAGDKVIEAAGDGRDRVIASVNYTLTAGQEVEQLDMGSMSGTAALNLTGNELANTIYGNAAANVLNGAGGNDRLNGGAGADTMQGGDGNDLYIVDNTGDSVIEAAGNGNDRVIASVNYTLTAGQEIEQLDIGSVSGTAALNLTGNEFANRIYPRFARSPGILGRFSVPLRRAARNSIGG